MTAFFRTLNAMARHQLRLRALWKMLCERLPSCLLWVQRVRSQIEWTFHTELQRVCESWVSRLNILQGIWFLSGSLYEFTIQSDQSMAFQVPFDQNIDVFSSWYCKLQELLDHYFLEQESTEPLRATFWQLLASFSPRTWHIRSCSNLWLNTAGHQRLSKTPFSTMHSPRTYFPLLGCTTFNS